MSHHINDTKKPSIEALTFLYPFHPTLWRIQLSNMSVYTKSPHFYLHLLLLSLIIIISITSLLIVYNIPLAIEISEPIYHKKTGELLSKLIDKMTWFLPSISISLDVPRIYYFFELTILLIFIDFQLVLKKLPTLDRAVIATKYVDDLPKIQEHKLINNHKLRLNEKISNNLPIRRRKL